MNTGKLLFFVVLVFYCAVAHGQSYSFGLDSCTYETFTVNGVYASGTEHVTQCGAPADIVLIGFKLAIPIKSGATVTGPVAIFASNVSDATSEIYTGCQIMLVSRLKASSRRLGWVQYIGCGDGGMYVVNYGYLTPRANEAMTGTASGVNSDLQKVD